jgi:hypothetical protein
LTSIACSLLLPTAADANPLTPEDVRAERKQIPREIAQEKAHAAELFRASRNTPLLKRVTSGVSIVENKLGSADMTIRRKIEETEAGVLGEKQFTLYARTEGRTYSGHHPTNSLPLYLDPSGRKKPETYLPSDELQRGVNILVPWKNIDAPACLTAVDLESYILVRCDLRLKTGDYWSQLHASRLTDEQLAKLRYYDYLDLHTPMQPVPVFHCTELRGRSN